MNSLKLLIVFSTSAFVFCLDQVSKVYVHTQMQVGESFPVIKNFFDITYVRNSGGAFGLFSDSHIYIRYVLFLFFPLVCIFLLFKILQDSHHKLQIVGLGFILGGAIGNYIDRIRLSYVIDFINWHIDKVFYWPIFNIADSFIVCGIFVMIGFYLLEMKKQ